MWLDRQGVHGSGAWAHGSNDFTKRRLACMGDSGSAKLMWLPLQTDESVFGG